MKPEKINSIIFKLLRDSYSTLRLNFKYMQLDFMSIQEDIIVAQVK